MRNNRALEIAQRGCVILLSRTACKHPFRPWAQGTPKFRGRKCLANRGITSTPRNLCLLWLTGLQKTQSEFFPNSKIHDDKDVEGRNAPNHTHAHLCISAWEVGNIHERCIAVEVGPDSYRARPKSKTFMGCSHRSDESRRDCRHVPGRCKWTPMPAAIRLRFFLTRFPEPGWVALPSSLASLLSLCVFKGESSLRAYMGCEFSHPLTAGH